MTVLEKNQELLRLTAPVTGRTLKEDGTVVNLADLAERVAAAVNDAGLISSLIYGTNSDGEAEAIDSTGGATHVMDGPKPSQYDGIIITDGVGITVALATGIKLGAGRIIATCLDGTNGAYIAFGTSAGDAIDNLNIIGGEATAGTYLPPDGGVTERLRGVGAEHEHYAVATAVNATTPSVNVEQAI